MKLVVRRALTTDKEGRLTAWLHERFQYPFEIVFTYHDEISRAASGKFFDFFFGNRLNAGGSWVPLSGISAEAPFFLFRQTAFISKHYFKSAMKFS